MENDRSSVPEPPARLHRVRELVLRYGWNSTSYQVINPGIDHWFSSEGDAVVGFVTRCRVRIVAGAPICAESRLADVAREFEQDATDAGERVCYFGAETRLESLYRGVYGYSMVALGAQPVWNPGQWKEMLAHHASLRAQLNRARNKGVSVSEWSADHATNNPALGRCLRQWLRTRGLPPLHFLVEPWTLARLADRRIFVAERRGEVVGFLITSPVPLRNGWLIEQNVRGDGAPNGTIELLIDAAVRAMAVDGNAYVTLGLSPLSRRARLPVDRNPVWLRFLLGWVRAHGRRFYNFEGLDAFKSKFRPARWEPIYAISDESSFSPTALYAVAAAFTHESPVMTVIRAVVRSLGTEIGWLLERATKEGEGRD